MEPLGALDRQAEAARGAETPRQEAGPGPAGLKRLRGAAREFEAMLIQHMLRSARESSLKGRAVAPGAVQGFHRDLADQEMARAVTGAGGLGLADILLQGLSRQAGGQKIPSSRLSAQPMIKAREQPTRIGEPR
jgi:Rod binding domain-containing protein